MNDERSAEKKAEHLRFLWEHFERSWRTPLCRFRQLMGGFAFECQRHRGEHSIQPEEAR